MRRLPVRWLLLAMACVTGIGCTATRSASREGTATLPDGAPPFDPLEATHPEPDLEERIAQAAARRSGGTVPAHSAQDEVRTPERTPPAPAPKTHTLEAGQTIYRVSVIYGTTPAEVMAANGITDPTTLKVGQVLKLPASAKAPGGGTTAAVAKAPAPEPKGGNRAQGRATRGQGRERAGASVATRGVLDWPLRGVLYARFGRKGKEPHDGIDLAAPRGTPVHVAGPGTVLYAGEQQGYGKIVLVEHADGLITLYAHNHDLRAKTGQTVRAGQVIATVGESGRTSGPHLHFEVRLEGRPVDPLQYLGDVPAR